MKTWPIVVALLTAAPVPLSAEEVRGEFSDEIADAGDIGVTIANYGRFGNDFRRRGEPSLEFPLGSGEEHMIRSGIWVGGIVIGEGGELDTLVTTATVDGTEGTDGGTETEYTPLRDTEWVTGNFLLRSRQPLANFSIDAIADEEVIAIFNDLEARGDPDDRDAHVPLGIRVRQEALLWGFKPFADIVFVNYEVTNLNPEADIFDLYVGFYAELTSGDKDGSTGWPPGGAWYGRKDIGYVDSLRVITEHRPAAAGDNLFASSWVGLQLLGATPGTIDDRTVSMNVWDWDPGAATRDEDIERYELMRNGDIDDTGGNEAGNTDPISLITVGPFANLGPAAVDTVRFSIAFLGGIDESEVLERSRDAQRAYDSGFRIPVPPTIPDFVLEPGKQRISLWWEDSPESVIDSETGEMDFEGYRIYVGRELTESSFELVKEVDIVDDYSFDPEESQEDIRFNTGLGSVVADEPLVRPNAQGELVEYKYRYDLTNVRDGFQYFVAITAFDKGSQETRPLETGISQTRTLVIPGSEAVADIEGDIKPSVFPNPYRGDAEWDGFLPRDRYLWFVNLPRRCTIRIYTLGGDLVDTIEFDGDKYAAEDVRGIYDPTDASDPAGTRPVLAGGMAAWDLITKEDQAVATGLYLFSVEDRNTGASHVGRFLVIK